MTDQYVPGGEPRAVVERVGRHSWLVYVSYTPTGCLPLRYGSEGYGSIAHSRRGAQSKARRLLRSFQRREGYERESFEVRGD